MEDKLIPTKKAAELLSVHVQTLYRMRREGLIEAVKIGSGGRNIRFRESDILKYLAGKFEEQHPNEELLIVE